MMDIQMDGSRVRNLRQRLHDGLGQSLSLAVMQIEMAGALEPDALRRTRVLLREALQELRSLIGSIGNAADTTEADLPGALAACVHRLNALQPIPVSFTTDGPPLRVPAQACEILLAATRELLVNACKHGAAIGVDARLSTLSYRLSITVTERPGTAVVAPLPGIPAPGFGLGLHSSRQRLGAIGARLRWRNGGRSGVQARISWVPQ